MFNYSVVLLAIMITSVLSLACSIYCIARGKVGDFEPLLYGAGFILFSAFIWADVFMFSILWIALVPILYALHDPKYLLLAWSGFWLIRSSGEVIYSFIQQFNPGQRPYAVYLPKSFMLRLFGPATFPKYWVIEQTFFQAISVLSFVLVVYTIVCLRQQP